MLIFSEAYLLILHMILWSMRLDIRNIFAWWNCVFDSVDVTWEKDYLIVLRNHVYVTGKDKNSGIVGIS